MMTKNKVVYHEVDFLLPAQRFNIQFSYISQRGLPFIREFVLRLVHVSPMTKTQISTYFGLGKRETNEAIEDLVDRGELTLSDNGRLTLTDKSTGYFSVIGESPQLASLQDSGTTLSFDLITFSCLGNRLDKDNWKAGVSLRGDDENISQSELLVEKHFQQQFHEIFESEYLPKAVSDNGKHAPSVYTVNAVTKLRELPLRLSTEFKMDTDGRAVERGDFEQLNSSESVHELIAIELSHLLKHNNIMDIVKSMMTLGDEDTLKLFDSKTNSFQISYLEDLNKLEDHQGSYRTSFVGPIYTKTNWDLLQKHLAPILLSRINSKHDSSNSKFIWIAPSDQFWAKSYRFISHLSDFINKASVNIRNGKQGKRIYNPTIWLPVADQEDKRTKNKWKYQLDPYHKKARALAEGFLDGNVEIIYLEEELVVVIYHLVQPDILPVTLPIGFISTDSTMVKKVGKLVLNYIEGSSSFDKPHDCGTIS